MTNNIKLLAIDLDNTLLTDQKTISHEDRMALKNCLDNGIEVVIASGRFLDSHKRLVSEIGLGLEDKIHIAEGGGLIYSKDRRIFLGEIPKKEYLNILTRLKDKNIIPFVSDGRNVFYEKTGPLNSIYGKDDKTDNSFLKEIKDLKDVLHPLKFILYWDEKSDLNELNKVLTNDTKAFISAKSIAEITSTSLDKWIALKKIIDSKNIDVSEVAAIGDSGNDLLMIKEAGLGLAVANSLPEIQKIANGISKNDNNHNAVSELINKYILC